MALVVMAVTSRLLSGCGVATIAIGDIHGCLPALDDLLDQIRGECTADDTVVFLGDYIDRGPRSRECVDAIGRREGDG